MDGDRQPGKFDEAPIVRAYGDGDDDDDGGSSKRGNPSPAVVRWPGITPFAMAPTAANDEDAAAVRTGSAPTDARTPTSSGPEHVIDNDKLPPSTGDIEAIPDGSPKKSDGPPVASSSAAVMPPPLHDPEPSGCLKTTGLRAEHYLDERFNYEAGEWASCPDYYTKDTCTANLNELPELFPRAAGITDEDGTTKREARGFKTTGLCAEDGLDKRFNREEGEGVILPECLHQRPGRG